MSKRPRGHRCLYRCRDRCRSNRWPVQRRLFLDSKIFSHWHRSQKEPRQLPAHSSPFTSGWVTTISPGSPRRCSTVRWTMRFISFQACQSLIWLERIFATRFGSFPFACPNASGLDSVGVGLRMLAWPCLWAAPALLKHFKCSVMPSRGSRMTNFQLAPWCPSWMIFFIHWRFSNGVPVYIRLPDVTANSMEPMVALFVCLLEFKGASTTVVILRPRTDGRVAEVNGKDMSSTMGRRYRHKISRSRSLPAPYEAKCILCKGKKLSTLDDRRI